jgi:hypothetical protein
VHIRHFHQQYKFGRPSTKRLQQEFAAISYFQSLLSPPSQPTVQDSGQIPQCVPNASATRSYAPKDSLVELDPHAVHENEEDTSTFDPPGFLSSSGVPLSPDIEEQPKHTNCRSERVSNELETHSSSTPPPGDFTRIRRQPSRAARASCPQYKGSTSRLRIGKEKALLGSEESRGA